MDGQRNKWTNRGTNGRTEKQTDKWRNKRINGGTNRRTDQTTIKYNNQKLLTTTTALQSITSHLQLI